MGDAVEVIAIDGLAGTGKSTLARSLASRLHLNYLDSGASFRMMALVALRAGVDLDNEKAVMNATQGSDLWYEKGECRIDSVEVTGDIRREDVSAAASRIAVHPQLRERLLAWQRRWVQEHGPSVVEGRDMTSVVFPDAAVKVFLEADVRVRAQRRSEASISELTLRDQRDSQRRVAPIVKVDDAVVIDTSNLTPSEVENRVAELWNAHRSSQRGIG